MKELRRKLLIIQKIFFVWAVFLLPLAIYAQSENFAGEWRSSLGKLTLIINGSTVEGFYTGGSVQGNVTGRVSDNGRLLAGKWALAPKSGRILLRLSEKGNAFYGYWWNGDSQLGGEWIGVRPDRVVTDGGVQASDFEGRWQSNYGRMNLAANGNRISGTFSGQKNDGKLSGEIDPRTNKLIGLWEDSGQKGRFIFKIIEGRDGFIGEWWYDDHRYGGFWYGVRPRQLEGCIAGNCDEGSGTFIWHNGSRYEGDWKDKIYHGAGAVYNRYGKMKNKGIWADGIYQGECLSGNCREGSGKLLFVSGDRYEGAFSNCLPDGKGVYLYLNGDRYEGDFKEGFLQGKGAYQFGINGDRYVGDFSRSKIQGRGIYHFQNGNVYEGTLRRGQRYGTGTMIWTNGDRYEGSWENDTMSGNGTYYYNGGDQYTGNFKNGMKEGQGTYTFSNETYFTAKWKADKVEDFRTSSSGYSGLAETTSEMSLPITMANQPAGSTVPASFPDPPNHYLIYNIVEEIFQPGNLSAQEQKQVTFSYYIIQSKRELDKAGLSAILEKKAGVENLSQFRIENVSDPNRRIKQILRRFQFEITSKRINILFEGFYREGE